VDLEALLAPIPGAPPTGVDLRASPNDAAYTKIKDTRSAARDAERRADTQEKPVAGVIPEWRVVIKLAEDALSRQTKDLEIACWLVEARVRVEGFAGLREGFELLKELVARYWDGLHSLKDEEGMATFVLPLATLNGIDGDGTLIQPILKVPLTTGTPGPYAAYHYHQALGLARASDKDRAKRIEAGVPTPEVFDEAVKNSPKEFLRSLLTNLAASLTELDSLQALLRQKLAVDVVPSTAKVKKTLEAVQDILQRFAAGVLPAETPLKKDVASTNGDRAPAGAHDEPESEPGMAAKPTDREDALRTLAKVSSYFRLAEPHSPIAFVLDDLIRRARMPLPELLVELMPDANARRAFLTSAGIRADAPQTPAGSAPLKS
jgi:type VI secretion system protein ImpA